MSEPIEAEHARHAKLVAALIAPHGGEVHIAELLSRWMSDREIGYLTEWITRARNEHTARYRDLLARVVAALSDATRDEQDRYHVVLGSTLVRHLLDTVQPPAAE
jgi:hypothetical protein